MGLFKRKKKEVVDDRTKIEKTFEEKGQELGRKTGKVVQKGMDKLDGVKQRLEEDGTMDQLREAKVKLDKGIDKVGQGIDKVVDEVTKKTKVAVDKVKEKTSTKEDTEFYE